MWDASLKRQNNSPSASAAFEAFGCRCPVFLVLAPACTAVMFGLLLSTSSRLTHILYAVFRRIKLCLAVGTSAPISQPDNGWIALRWRSREHESPLVQEGWRWELPHASLKE